MLKKTMVLIVLLGFIQPLYADNQVKLENRLKGFFNDVAIKVKQSKDPAEKRKILNNAFEKGLRAVDAARRVPTIADEDMASLNSFRGMIQERHDELNGLNGFAGIQDVQLDDFSEYTQQGFEQAAKTVTISVTTLLLIIIVAILIS